MRASKEIRIAFGDDLETLKRCGGYYQCPRDQNGKRLGPLVGYAARYDNKHQWVGDIYYNFAMGEQYPHVRDYFALQLVAKFRLMELQPDVIIGAPMGGILLSGDLGRHLDCRTIFLEKRILELATPSAREKAVLAFIRHSIRRGDKAIVGEDLVNNLSTTEEANGIIEAAGGTLVAISCECNRSSQTYYSIDGRDIPIVANLQLPTKQYRQDDPEVAADIAAGNVILKPKDQWSRLAQAMADAA